jgi:manganese/iron transport system ATP-binding protein
MGGLVSRPADHVQDAPAIEVDRVSVRFNGLMAIGEMSFSIPTGARVALVGPNGAGKTTLLRLLAGVLKPTSGRVHIYGADPGGHVCIAYVPQRSQIDRAFPVSVREVVMMGRIRRIGLFRWPSRRDWEFVDGALQRVEMDQLCDRRIGELSGGQQQRVFLAQALAQEAELVLLDEPLTGLDIPSQERLLDLLSSLHADGVTQIVATHDLQLAASHFEHVMLLNRQLVALGTPVQVLTHDALRAAYGDHLHTLGEDGRLVFTDTCCDGEELSA